MYPTCHHYQVRVTRLVLGLGWSRLVLFLIKKRRGRKGVRVWRMISFLLFSSPPFLLSEICEKTSIRKEDVVATLQYLQLIHYYKGQHIISLSQEVLDHHHKSMSKRKIRIDPRCIRWTPKDWSRRGKW